MPGHIVKEASLGKLIKVQDIVRRDNNQVRVFVLQMVDKNNENMLYNYRKYTYPVIYFQISISTN